jgi:dolichyl-phosphate beta-glucosyltransferase
MEKAAVAKRSWLRNFLMHGFHALVTLVAGHAVKDTQCGFKVGWGWWQLWVLW